MKWYMVVHGALIILFVIGLCIWLNTPDYDEEGKYVPVSKRLRIVLSRLFLWRD